jgi:hypothetical protein
MLLAGPHAGLWAAVIYAFYPYLVRQSVARLEITLCATLAIAATLALTRTERLRGAIGTGVLFGLLMLTRTSFVIAAIGAALWLARHPSTRFANPTSFGAGGRSRLGVAMLLSALIVEAPWLVRNTRIDGSPLPARVGENLYLSTSDYAAAVPEHDIDLLVPLALAELDRVRPSPELGERVIDDAMLALALAFIREHPGRALWLKARNALYLFSPLLLPRDAKGSAGSAMMDGPAVRVVNAARRPWIEDASHTAAQAAMLLLAGVGLARRRLSHAPAGDAPLLIMLGAQAVVCIAFFPTTRLMAPVMFVLMFYAAAGLTSSSAAAPPRP